MKDFLLNVTRYPRYLIAFSLGVINSVLEPLARRRSNPVTAVALVGAHVGSGVLRAQTVPFSLVLIVPAVLGMWIGGRLQGGIDKQLFRRLTLVVLAVAGLNLIRRGLLG